MYSLTDQLSLLRREEHVDVVWVNGRGEVLVTVGYSGASDLKLPSVDLESCKIRVGDSGDLPGDVTIIGAWVSCEPVEGASIVRTLGIRRLKSKAKGNGWPSRLTAENSANNAHVKIVGGPTRSQAKQARDLAAVH